MAKKAAAAEAKGFESLSDEDKSWIAEYEDLGWLIQFGDNGWGAVKSKSSLDGEALANPYELGPEQSFMKLMNMVTKGEKSIKSAAKADMNSKGDRFLNGMEATSIPELDDFIKRRDEAVRWHRKYTKDIQALNAEGLDLYDKHKVQFGTDPETGKPIYNSSVGGYMRIGHVDKVETGGVEADD